MSPGCRIALNATQVALGQLTDPQVVLRITQGWWLIGMGPCTWTANPLLWKPYRGPGTAAAYVLLELVIDDPPPDHADPAAGLLH